MAVGLSGTLTCLEALPATTVAFAVPILITVELPLAGGDFYALTGSGWDHRDKGDGCINNLYSHRRASSSGQWPGCLARVQRTARNGRVQPVGFLFVDRLVLLVEIRYVSQVEPRMRPLGETAGRLRDPYPCPTGLLILFSCCVKCRLWTECRKIVRAVGPS